MNQKSCGSNEWDDLCMVICYRKGLVSLFPHVNSLVPFSASEKSYGNKEWDSLVMVTCYRKGLVLLLPHVKGLSPEYPPPRQWN